MYLCQKPAKNIIYNRTEDKTLNFTIDDFAGSENRENPE